MRLAYHPAGASATPYALSQWVAAGKLGPTVTGPGRTGVRLFDRQYVEDWATS